MRTPRSLTLGLVLVATTGGLAACGGGGGGDEDAYVKTYQDTCTKLQNEAKAITPKLTAAAQSAGSDQAAALSKVKPILISFYDDLISNVKTLADADAPSKYSDYQDKVKEQSSKATDALTKAKGDIQKASSGSDLSQLGSSLQGLDFGDADAPADLKKAAPACGQLNSGAGATG